MKRVVVHIESLVLKGFSPGDRCRFAADLREGMAPPLSDGKARFASADGAGFAMRTATRDGAKSIGAAIAKRINAAGKS